jgi:hypothetical protein
MSGFAAQKGRSGKRASSKCLQDLSKIEARLRIGILGRFFLLKGGIGIGQFSEQRNTAIG